MNRSTTRPEEPNKRFKVGSAYFFGDQGTDIDEVEFEDQPRLYKNVLQFRKKDGTRCLFKWRRMDPDEFVEYTLRSSLPMEIGKFLVPEVAEFLGISLEHLKRLQPVAERLDEKHKYEKIIYDAYMENGGLYLTAEQRAEAYREYCRARR